MVSVLFQIAQVFYSSTAGHTLWLEWKREYRNSLNGSCLKIHYLQGRKSFNYSIVYTLSEPIELNVDYYYFNMVGDEEYGWSLESEEDKITTYEQLSEMIVGRMLKILESQ